MNLVLVKIYKARIKTCFVLEFLSLNLPMLFPIYTISNTIKIKLCVHNEMLL